MMSMRFLIIFHGFSHGFPMVLEVFCQALLLWNAAFPSQRLEAFEKGQRWKELGFQGVDPSTDVRTGSWPLEQLAA